jgi:hypothetical protein
MHLLIILLQQLLGMLPSSKQVPQPEVVRKGSASPNSGEPDACGRIALPLCGWMTPFKPLHIAAGQLSTAWSGRRIASASPVFGPETIWHFGIAALRARGAVADRVRWSTAGGRRTPKT